MEDNQKAISSQKTAFINFKRVKYSSPKLRIYGSVQSITQAKGGTLSDGASGMNMA
jgi:hypothetical protein